MMQQPDERTLRPEDFVPLDRAAELLNLTRGALWKRLCDAGIAVVHAPEAVGPRTARPVPGPDGDPAVRRVPGLRRDALIALGQRWGITDGADGRPDAEREPLWQAVRGIELERDRLAFENRVLTGQLGDARKRAELGEESLQVAQARLTAAQNDLERELSEGPERDELQERVRAADRRLAGLTAELAQVQATLESESARSAAAESALARERAELERQQASLEHEHAELERQQAALGRERAELEREQAALERERAEFERERSAMREHEQAREAYCDRIEAELAARRDAGRSGGGGKRSKRRRSRRA